MSENINLPNKKKIRQAGEILRKPSPTSEELRVAMDLLSQWRQVQRQKN